MKRLSAALLECGVFDALNAAGLAMVERASAQLSLETGRFVFREGEAADAMFVVLEGAVQVVTHDVDGHEVVLARLEAGDHFGEQALLPGSTGRRNAAVRAVSHIVLARIPKAAFDAVLVGDGALHDRLLTLGQDQVQANLERLSSLARALELARLEPVKRSLGDGEVLFRQGDQADALYLVLAGRIAIHREDAGTRILVSHVARGGCVGELALVRSEPRAATATADGAAEVLVIRGDQFAEAYARSSLLREHITTLAWVYMLPSRGLLTQQTGEFEGQGCVITLYQLDDGRRLTAYRGVSSDFYLLVERGAEASLETLRYTDEREGRTRELGVAPDGTVRRLVARGLWEDAGALHLSVLDGERISAEDRALFLRSGYLVARREPADDLLCRCVGASVARLRAAIGDGARTLAQLQKETRCGTVCGGCVPGVLELLGGDVWEVADVVAEHEECPGVRSFELAPRAEGYPPSEPGQHVVVEGVVGGVPVRRPYTITSARRSHRRIRITVKREPGGVLSEWLFDRRQGAPLRISRPRGNVIVDLAAGPWVFLVAGVGVTPALAAVRTVVDENLVTSLVVHGSARTGALLPGRAELEQAARERPSVRLILRETAHEGRIDQPAVASLVEQSPNATFFLCGPPSYLEEVGRLVREAGVPAERVRVEQFTPSGGPPPTVSTVEERREVERFMLVAPEPETPRTWLLALRRAGLAVSRALNGRLTDWRVGGVQLNPLRAAARHLVAAPNGIDPAVPYEHLGALTILSTGPFTYQTEVFDRIAELGERNRERARAERAAGRVLPSDTPDGDTFAYTTPSPPLVQFPAECAVNTGWTSASPGRFLAMYAVRGRAALDHVLRRREHTDRGPIPYHYFQQVVGRRDAAVCPGRKAAGLFAGQFHDNQTWSDDRALTTEMFGLATIDAFAPMMATALGEVCESLDASIARAPEAAIDLNVLTSKIAYTIIVRAVFGNADLGKLHALGDELSRSIRELLQYVYQFVMGRQSIPSDYREQWERGHRATEGLIDLLRDLDRQGRLDERQRAVPAVKLALETDGGYDRLFTLFVPLILAGHETTGHTLSWAIYELCRNPSLERAIVDEIRAFQAAHDGRAITIADYDERPLSLALLAEVLRLHSPVASAARTALADGVVPPDPETGIGGFRYPKGAVFVCSVLGVHLDPHRWTDPLEFRIERFLDGVDACESLTERGRRVRRNLRAREEALDLLAFVDGPGRCPGQYFNAHEFLLVLDALVSRYRFELVDPTREVRHADTMIVSPEKGRLGVRVRLRAGESAGNPS